MVLRRALEPVLYRDEARPMEWRVREPGGREIGAVVKREEPVQPIADLPIFVALACDGRELGEFASRASAADTIARDWKAMQVQEYAHRRIRDGRREQQALALLPPLTLSRGTI